MDISKLLTDLQKAGKTEKIKDVAGSKDGQRISELVDGATVERAVKSGDMETMQAMLKKVMSTEEGKRLARQLDDLMK